MVVDSFSATTAAKEEEEKDEEATTGVILVHGEEGKDLVVKKACREEEGERELSRTEERRSRRAAIGDGNAAMLKIDRQSHRQTDRQKRRSRITFCKLPRYPSIVFLNLLNTSSTYPYVFSKLLQCQVYLKIEMLLSNPHNIKSVVKPY